MIKLKELAEEYGLTTHEVADTARLGNSWSDATELTEDMESQIRLELVSLGFRTIPMHRGDDMARHSAEERLPEEERKITGKTFAERIAETRANADLRASIKNDKKK